MATVAISQIPGVAEPLRGYLWELAFVSPESLLIKVGIGDSKPVVRQEVLAL